jgi:hypothetical protein
MSSCKSRTQRTHIKLHILHRYNATLGHKVNHSFEPNCEFVLFSAHPVLGTVMALAAMEDLQPGQELTVNYGSVLDQVISISSPSGTTIPASRTSRSGSWSSGKPTT